MALIQDRVVLTKPTRVYLGVDKRSSEVKDFTIVDRVVAEWWVPEGAELVLHPWMEHGVRTQGWKVTREEGVQVVPEMAGTGSINWKAIAQDLASAIDEPNEDPIVLMTAALDRFRLAEMFEAEQEREKPKEADEADKADEPEEKA